MIRSAGAAVTLLAIVLSACGFQSHRPIADGTYILLLDIPKDAGTSFLLTGSKTYHSSGQWDLPVSLRNTVRAIVNQYDLRVVDR